MPSISRFNEDKQKFIEALGCLPSEMATQLVCLLAVGAVSVIREDYSHWPNIENLVFNATLLLFCKDKLANDDLAEMINSGIQIDDLKHFTDDHNRFIKITDDVRAQAMRIWSRTASDSSPR